MDEWIAGLLDELGIRVSGDAQVQVGSPEAGGTLNVGFGVPRWGGVPVWAWVLGGLLALLIVLQLKG